MSVHTAAAGSRVERSAFGTVADGRAIERFTLRNGAGMAVSILTYGGILQAVEVPDRSGEVANVTLGFAELAGYRDAAYMAATPFFGALIGRYANRIAGGRFALDGAEYSLAVNEPPNHLHGGGAAGGFDLAVWEAEPVFGGVRLSHVSPAGEAGYPGELRVAVAYTLGAGNELRIAYEATTDAPTIVNLTSHAYWNLAGEGSGTIYGHTLRVPGSYYTPVDSNAIPTGALAPVAGTRFDFTRARELGDGYDHNWALDGARAGVGRVAAELFEPSSGRLLTVETDQPGIQVYSGNFLDGTLRGAGGRTYPRGAGVALETQHFPDSPNHPGFPSTTLRPGDSYRSTTTLRFSTRP